MAASLAVVYPYRTTIGGDGFWLISKDGADPIAVDACGGAAAAAAPQPEAYQLALQLPLLNDGLLKASEGLFIKAQIDIFGWGGVNLFGAAQFIA